MSSKYLDSIKLLTSIEHGAKKERRPTPSEKQLIKTLTQKGYIERNINHMREDYSLTEKGAKTLEEHSKINEIMEKIREGNHPSRDHQGR